MLFKSIGERTCGWFCVGLRFQLMLYLMFLFPVCDYTP